MLPSDSVQNAVSKYYSSNSSSNPNGGNNVQNAEIPDELLEKKIGF